jgi:uncharacterized protein (TIGR02246 family)
MNSLEHSRLHNFGTRYAAAWCSQDPARVAQFFSPDGSLQVNDAAPAVGRPAITEVARGFMTALPDMHVVMDAVEGGADRVVFRWTLIGTNTGPGGTGRKVHISGFEEWSLGSDGLIARSLGHLDAAEYQRQLDGR